MVGNKFGGQREGLERRGRGRALGHELLEKEVRVDGVGRLLLLLILLLLILLLLLGLAAEVGRLLHACALQCGRVGTGRRRVLRWRG